MLTPPSIAVGFLCQRSILGFATTPALRATARTKGVNRSASANDRATVMICRGLKGITAKLNPNRIEATNQDTESIAERAGRESMTVYLKRILILDCRYLKTAYL